MEAFSLLKYWKSSAGGGIGGGNGGDDTKHSPTTVVATTVNHLVAAVDDGDDDGPFFDLEFAVPADVDEEEEVEVVEERRKVEERETEIQTETESETETENEVDDDEQELRRLSPSEEVFFNGSDSAPLSEMEEIINSTVAGNSNSGQLSLPVSLVKSATKLRIFMLGLKRSKSESKQIPEENLHRNNNNNNNSNNNKSNDTNNSCKFMTVRLKMEDMKVPKISLLTRVSSNVVKNTHANDNHNDDDKLDGENNNNEEKKSNNKKEVVQRYLKLVKPLYVKVSKRSSNQTVVSAAEVVLETAETATVKSRKQRLNLKVLAKKHLVKSKSAVVHSMPTNNNNSNSNNKTTSLKKKSDETMLQHEDSIQSAILHCKRSFNSSSSSSSEDGEETTSVLVRSASEPSPEKKLSKVVDEE
ncbi:hypothetical protein RND81_08G110700 [Saponaria officinalis]|uniref:Membrane-associated kinase regulator 2 n=1 Tax=Saponaria officinalis TaxID=3572 RepID=A0AAW1J5G7_SAPOF